MRGTAAIALFCESIRQEIGGTETLVGIMGDNLNVPAIPGILPRLAVYIRIQLELDEDPNPVSVSLKMLDRSELFLTTLDPDFVNKTRAKAKASGLPYAGVRVRSEVLNLQVKNVGRIEAVVKTAAEEIFCGALTFKLKPESTDIVPSTPSGPAPASTPARRYSNKGKKRLK